jgi:hypothetical protein
MTPTTPAPSHEVTEPADRLSEERLREMVERRNRYANCIVFIDANVADDARAEFLSITDEMLTELRALTAREEAMRAALEAVEWVGRIGRPRPMEIDACALCGRSKVAEHREDCLIRAALALEGKTT